MTASDARPPSDTGATVWHMHSGRAAYRDDQCARHADDVNPARPVIVVDPAEARETIAREALAEMGRLAREDRHVDSWPPDEQDCHRSADWHSFEDRADGVSRLLADKIAARALAALAGQEQL